MFAYPDDLMIELKRAEGKPILHGLSDIKLKLPHDVHLSQLLTVAYHASFLTEESRRIGFRLVYFPKKEWSERLKLPSPDHNPTIPFLRPRPFTVAEVLRLAPAADYSQMLICVGSTNVRSDKKEAPLKIWDLVNAGSSWWEFIRGGISGGSCPPNRLTVSSTEPGSLSISWAGFLILRLRQGQLLKSAGSLIQRSGPIGSFFEPASEEMQKQVDATFTSSYVENADQDYPKRSYLRFLQSILFHIRDKSHGGTILVVPDRLHHSDSRLTDRVNIKYPINHHHSWDLLKDFYVLHRKYYDLVKKLRKSNGKARADHFNEYTHVAYLREENEVDVSDAAKFVASLSGIDGAVVMTDKYRILGFGGEVIITSPTLDKVRVALDDKGNRGKFTSIESYGTRHRSSFRICSNYEDCLSFVVSQDGGIKAVRRVGPELVIWLDINMMGRYVL